MKTQKNNPISTIAMKPGAGSAQRRGEPGSQAQRSDVHNSFRHGGRTTISPPSNVNNTPFTPPRVLASGLDTLVLAIDVIWHDDQFFRHLALMKEMAQLDPYDGTVLCNSPDDRYDYIMQIFPNGTSGYEWMLKNREFTLKIGNWSSPISRPSIMATIHSETLWRLGAKEAVFFLSKLIDQQKGQITNIKVSRVDLCCDVMLSNSIWNKEILNSIVTRSTHMAPFFYNLKLSGVQIGKGQIVARLYDKPLEINQKSKKFWMYDIWKIDQIGEDQQIIRVEFQIRREALKNLGVNTSDHLFLLGKNIWAYCAQDWLKFQDRPGKHPNQRSTYDWWKIVQDGYDSSLEAYPLIRQKAIKGEIDRAFASVVGYLGSIAALDIEKSGTDAEELTSLKEAFELVESYASKNHIDDMEFTKRVFAKQAKMHRSKEAMKQAHKDRVAHNFPSNIPVRLQSEIWAEKPPIELPEWKPMPDESSEPEKVIDFGPLFGDKDDPDPSP
jgi:hypothetical protein